MQANYPSPATRATTSTATAVTSAGTSTTGPAENTDPPDHGSGTSIDDAGDAVTVRSEIGQFVSGTTDRQPGTELAVRLQRQDGSSPFLKQRVVSVQADGRFEASFDIADIEPGAQFTVTVYHDGDEVAAAPGEVAEG